MPEVIDRPWRELEECKGEITNFDRTIDPGVEEDLRTGKKWCTYAAWNFCGYVWFADDQYHCDVWRHGCSIEVISAPTLEELMTAVSEDYGYD